MDPGEQGYFLKLHDPTARRFNEGACLREAAAWNKCSGEDQERRRPEAVCMELEQQGHGFELHEPTARLWKQGSTEPKAGAKV